MFEAILHSIIQTYGPFGLLVAMIIQTIIAPIPSEALIMFAGAIQIDILTIVIFAGLGSIIGAIIAFFVGRIGGKPIVLKLLGEEWIDNVDEWVNEKGTKAIFITRLIPVIPFDLISYISGVTSLEFRKYLLATVLGAFPRCLLLAVIGSTAGKALRFVGVGLELMILLGTVGFIVLIFLDRKGYLGGIKKLFLGKLMKEEKV